MKKKLLSTTSEWTLDRIQRYDREIARIAKHYQLETYPNRIEIINSEQMLDAYSSVGMPMNYHHWSFGKKFLDAEKEYRRGFSGLAYEMVINSDPCISYLLEENSMVTQAVVIAHACYGHNSFFKNNYLFQLWTHAGSIIDYLVFAKKYIQSCEEKYGISKVEELLDASHALMNYGVDRYHRPAPLSLEKEKEKQKEREAYLQSQINELWRVTLRDKAHKKAEQKEKQALRFPPEPQENILYFIEKNAPLLEPWQREIIRIVRKIAQYFYPQRQTKMMNEGWATFWHYTIIQKLYDEKLVNDQFMLEFLPLHTNVILQLPFDHPRYMGINPYALGFKIFSDIKASTGDKWIEAVDFAMRNYKDESFIAQYLSPKIIRDMRLFAIIDDEKDPELKVSAIHNEEGYQAVREALSRQYNLSQNEPDIQVYSVNQRGDRSLTLRYIPNNNRPLSEDTEAVLKHLRFLWSFPVRLETVDNNGDVVSVREA
jgi:spore cortex formation protein SpoVR/YcgB (stage V sporulation)